MKNLKRKVLILLVATIVYSCGSPGNGEVIGSKNGFSTSDADAIKKAVDGAYDIISFKQGHRMNFDSIRTVFIPEAQLMNFRSDSLQVLSLNEFIKAYEDFVKDNGVRSFFEKEIAGRTDQFGKIAQRISTYASYINNPDSLTERGVNSFQLVKTAGSWKVASIIWDVERKSQPIPKFYLGDDSSK